MLERGDVSGSGYRLTRRTVLLVLAGGVACWLLLRFGPSADRSEYAGGAAPASAAQPLEAADEARVPRPAPPPLPAPPPPANSPVVERRSEPPQLGPAATPKPRFDPATDPPTIHSRDGLRIERTWGGDSRALPKAFGQHGKEFSARSVFHYAAMAAHFFQEAPKYGFPTKVDEDGVIRIYDPGSNSYGEYNPDGTTRAFFRPKQGVAFWDEQPGTAPLSP